MPVCGAAGDDVDVVVATARWPRRAAAGAVERLHLDAGDEHRVARSSPSHSTSIRRAAWALVSDTALAQSARCTVTPRPRVTKPMISSPGTGVQQPRQAHQHVVEALDVDADVVGPRAVPAGPQRRWPASCSSSSPLRNAAGDPLGDATGPTRGARRWPRAARRGRRSCSRRCTSLSSVRRPASSAPAGPRGGAPWSSSSRPGLDHVVAALAAEPLADLVAGPRATRRTAASRATGRRARPSR